MKIYLVPLFLAFSFTVAAAAEPHVCAKLPGLKDGSGQPVVRGVVGKPLLDAVALLKVRKGKEALVRAEEAQRVVFKTPFEECLVNDVMARARRLATRGL